jgi:hypothetical protein
VFFSVTTDHRNPLVLRIATNYRDCKDGNTDEENCPATDP